MQIITDTITAEDLKMIAQDGFGDMVKAVVDVEREVVALDAELHSDLEALLLEDGSKQADLWGINFYPDLKGEDFLEFDSMINMRPSQGNMTRGIDDDGMRDRIKSIVNKRVST